MTWSEIRNKKTEAAIQCHCERTKFAKQSQTRDCFVAQNAPRNDDRRGGSKAQVAPFLVLLIAVLLLAIVATMLIGEAAYNKIRLSNVTDGALISSASSYCRGLNQLKQIKRQLELNWLTMQAYLLSVDKAPCASCGQAGILKMWSYKPEPLTDPQFLTMLDTSRKGFDQADAIVKEMTKDLRSGLYDGIISGSLTDEPKPFLESEVYRDDAQGTQTKVPHKVMGFNFDAYAKRESRSTLILRAFKTSNYDGWFLNNTLTYYYSKSKDKVLELIDAFGNPVNPLAYIKNSIPPAVFPNADGTGTEAYLTMSMHGVPTSVSVEPRRMPLFYIVGKCVSP
ncbi:MAG: hypothetical protein NTY47_05355, partial [Candidatus Omnitrophica bacterium]|nr:hypothetical protein [Candidatus Omnitrophota bacterium]